MAFAFCYPNDPNNEDEEVYARGLANYGLQTQQQMKNLHSQIHEPIYVGYSPDNSTIYGTSSRKGSVAGTLRGSFNGGTGKKVPPKVPPKPSINALLGIGIVMPNQGVSNSTTDIYGTAKATRHISHV